MKKIILLCLVVFGSVAAQKTDTTGQEPKVPQITLNADEFNWAKDIIYSLALENQKLQTKKEMTALDLGYNLIKDNYKLKAELENLKTLTNSFATDIKNAKTIPEVKKILQNYGIK